MFARANTAAQRRFVLWMTAVMTVYSYWIATDRTWDSRHTDVNYFGADFFRNQADAILHGRLHVPFAGYSWTECVMMQGKCYGYFGIFPSILRFPEFLLTGTRTVNHIPVYVALAVGIGFWASMDLFMRVMREVADSKGISNVLAQRVLVLGTLLIGPGSVLVFLAKAAVYEEAIVWAVAMTMVVANMVHRWAESHRHVHLVIAVIAGVAAVNSRFSAVPAAVVMGGYLLWQRRRDGRMRSDVPGLRLEIALILAPVITYTMVMYAKFGQFSAPASATTYYNDQIMVAIRESNNGSYTGPRFILTNLAQFLRPDSLKLSSNYPWIKFAVVNTDDALILPPLVRQGTMADHAISITNTMITQLVLSVSVVTVALKRALKSRLIDLPLVLLVATAGVIGPALLMYSNTARYTGDFYPFLATGSIFGLAMVLTTDSMTAALKRVVLDIGIVFGLASCYIWYILQINRW